MTDPAPKIAVTVLGGYLGAGKTTLLNNILCRADERLAVLVNDFGEINIDAALIESVNGTTINLANGCVCCTLADGLANTLLDIDGLEPRPERLIIETSGVANPAGVAAYCHRRGFRLDAVVVLVDAETITTGVDDIYIGETVRSQLRAADLVVLNKVDLVDASTLESARGVVVAEAPLVPIVETVNAELTPEVLFDRQTMSSQGEVHSHGADFETWSFSESTPITRDEIDRFMADLSQDIVRVKGLVQLNDDSRRHVLQRVGPRWTLSPSGEWDDAPNTTLVAIGRPGSEPTWPGST
ncbi:MAG: GTP-binding protein [Actinomycetia bacterium]|nr:GTP-binding protein [Actinomycetes bacterium]MCP4962734.1 GTP-binding protein [Actinomycetes bacterium]